MPNQPNPGVRTEGARLFDKFLADNDITLGHAAQALGVRSSATILDLRRGQKRPRPDLADRIEIWTGGKVKRRMWYTRSELKALDRQARYRPSAARAA